MNETEKAELRDLIETRLAELSGDLARGKDGEAIVTLDQQSVGRLSRMDALQNQAMARAQSARRSSDVARLQEALERLDIDDYGYCEDCEEPIAIGRLRLDPAVQLCVFCASG